jgi:hypothetical protein
VLRYLAVAHFGRGRGNFVEGEAPAFWQAEVEAAVNGQHGQLWQSVRATPDQDKAEAQVEAVVTAITAQVLAKLYPGAQLSA